MRTILSRCGVLGLAALLAGALCVPASARDGYVQDGAGLFTASTVAKLNTEIGDFNRQTGKEVVVVTVPSLDGATPQDAAVKVFAQQQVNGVLIFLAKAEKKDGIIGDRASHTFFPAGSFDAIRSAMRGYFQSDDFDTGITTGVGLIINQYRGHESSLGTATQSQRTYVPSSQQSIGGGGMSLFWLILILIAIFLVIRAVFRAIFGGGRRMAPPGYGGPGPGGPGYGGGYGGGMPGYGYGGGGGGGNFFSGLLGGLGGAFLGNELFGHQNFGGGVPGVQSGGFVDPGTSQDAGGWQSDAGQADTSNASFGDYGSSGGGFGDGGGGGDFGGGGDSGGGW